MAKNSKYLIHKAAAAFMVVIFLIFVNDSNIDSSNQIK